MWKCFLISLSVVCVFRCFSPLPWVFHRLHSRPFLSHTAAAVAAEREYCKYWIIWKTIVNIRNVFIILEATDSTLSTVQVSVFLITNCECEKSNGAMAELFQHTAVGQHYYCIWRLLQPASRSVEPRSYWSLNLPKHNRTFVFISAQVVVVVIVFLFWTNETESSTTGRDDLHFVINSSLLRRWIDLSLNMKKRPMNWLWVCN